MLTGRHFARVLAPGIAFVIPEAGGSVANTHRILIRIPSSPPAIT